MKNTNTAKQTNKNDGAFMKICVIAIFVIVTVYAFAHLVFSFVAGVEIAPVSSSGFFLFFAGEAGILSYIKKMKHDKAKEDKEDEEGTAENDGECDYVDFSDDHSISD